MNRVTETPLKKNSLWLKVGLIAISGSVFCNLAGAQDNAPVQLAMKFKPGEVNKYATTTTIGYSIPGFTMPQSAAKPGKAAAPASPGSTITINGTQVMKVMKVQKNGAGEIEVTTDMKSPMMAMMGQSAKNNKPEVSTIVCDSLGHITGQPGFSFLSTGGLVFHNKPIKPGESWVDTQTVQKVCR